MTANRHTYRSKLTLMTFAKAGAHGDPQSGNYLFTMLNEGRMTRGQLGPRQKASQMEISKGQKRT